MNRYTIKKTFIGSCIAFISLTVLVTQEGTRSLDEALNRFFNTFQTQFGIIIARDIGQLTSQLNLSLIALLIASVLIYRQELKSASRLLLGLLGTSLSVTLIKNMVGIARPLNAAILEGGFAFPSGHTATSFFISFWILFSLSKTKEKRLFKYIGAISAVLFGILVAGSRLYLGVHWFSDILGGILLALIWALGTQLLIKERRKD
ncbi:phosphatase PAP2 family protein [Candidatus Pacearchaeota archaeon]|nr:phosphatase PAP2 family protein [Candidatus Pacearchaeota archaeon]